MEIQITNKHIIKLNNWLSFYGDENKDAECTGIYAGIKHVLQKFGVYYNVTSKKPISITVEKDIVDGLIEYMKKNSINAMWNLGVASGICWVLELFNILDTDYSNK